MEEEMPTMPLRRAVGGLETDGRRSVVVERGSGRICCQNPGGGCDSSSLRAVTAQPAPSWSLKLIDRSLP